MRSRPIPDAAFSIRPLGTNDGEAVVDLYQRTHRDDPTVSAVSLAGWQHFAAAAHNQGGRDFRVAVAARGEAAGRIVGVATTSQRPHMQPLLRHFRIVVEPAWRRRGVARALLGELAALDAPLPAVLQTLCPETWRAGAAFLAAAGFSPLEVELDMECAMLVEPRRRGPRRRGPWTVRHVADPGPLAERFAAIHNSAYAGTASFVQLSAAEMSELLSGAALWVAVAGGADHGGAVIALCHIEREGARLRLESLAVDPAWQGCGVGSDLAYRALIEAGARKAVACLSVSDHNPPALAAYQRLGFRPVFSSTRYRADRAEVLANTTRGRSRT